jgi:hypothetical protein
MIHAHDTFSILDIRRAQGEAGFEQTSQLFQQAYRKRQVLIGTLQQGCGPFRADPHSGETLNLLKMPVLLPEKSMSQLGIGRLKALPLYVIVQTGNLYSD